MNNIELVNTDFFDPEAIRLPSYKVGRISYGDSGRGYVKIVNGELELPLKIYTSLTTAISTCAPMEAPLLKWHCDLGLAEAKRYTSMKAAYGTLMHLFIGEYLTGNFFDFDATKDKVAEYVTENRLTFPEIENWDKELNEDVAAFIAFSQEHKIKPLGIEYVLVSDKHGFGTLIDLVCKMTVSVKGQWGEVYKSGPRKGEPKETYKDIEQTAIINFKSGRHNFYRSNGIQAIAEKMLWEENFPDIPLDAAYNWSPKDWIINPSWNFKEWTTDDISQEEVELVLKMAQIRFGGKALKKKYISLSGMARSTAPVSDCIHQQSVEEYALEHFSNLMT